MHKTRKVTLIIPADDAVVRDIVKDLLEYTRNLQTEGYSGPIHIEHDAEIHNA